MRNEVAEMFGIDPMSEEVQLVRRQNRNDNDTLDQLILRREEKFPDLESFASEIGMAPQVVADFEERPNEASIRFLQMYALGLGVEIQHRIVTQEERRTQNQGAEMTSAESIVERWVSRAARTAAGRSVFKRIEQEGAQYV